MRFSKFTGQREWIYSKLLIHIVKSSSNNSLLYSHQDYARAYFNTLWPALDSFIILLLFFFLIFWLCWVFVAARRLSLVAAREGYSSLWWFLLLQSTGSGHPCFSSCSMRAQELWHVGPRVRGALVVAHGLSCSAACGIFLDQGSNPCPLHWQVNS